MKTETLLVLGALALGGFVIWTINARTSQAIAAEASVPNNITETVGNLATGILNLFSSSSAGAAGGERKANFKL